MSLDCYILEYSQACEKDFLYISHHIIGLFDLNACDFTLGKRETQSQLNDMISFVTDYPEGEANKIFFSLYFQPGYEQYKSSSGLLSVACRMALHFFGDISVVLQRASSSHQIES